MNKCIIIGGGPSLKPELPEFWDKIKGKADIISLNYIYETMPYFPDYQLFTDQHFWNEEERKVTTINSQRTEIIHNKMSKLKEQGVNLVYRFIGPSRKIGGAEIYHASRNFFGRKGIEKNKIYYGQSGLVGLFALSWAICKFDEIYLIGFDLFSKNGLTHSYQNDIKTSSYGVGNKDLMKLYNNNLNEWKVFLDIKDVLVYNVSIESRINVFPKISYGEFYDRIH